MVQRHDQNKWSWLDSLQTELETRTGRAATRPDTAAGVVCRWRWLLGRVTNERCVPLHLDLQFPTGAHLVCPAPRSPLRGQMALAVGIRSSFSGGAFSGQLAAP